jgi:hypothetical protein
MSVKRPKPDAFCAIFGHTYAEHELIRKRFKGQAPRVSCPCGNTRCSTQYLQKWGDIKAPHLSILSENGCGMTIEHASAQSCIMNVLNRKCALQIKQRCNSCNSLSERIVRLEDNEICRSEAFFMTGERRNFADLGIVKAGDATNTLPRLIIEILHTSKTKEENRPCDVEWYEIRADEINNAGDAMCGNQAHMRLNCTRKWQCSDCDNEIQMKPFTKGLCGVLSSMRCNQWYAKLCALCNESCVSKNGTNDLLCRLHVKYTSDVARSDCMDVDEYLQPARELATKRGNEWKMRMSNLNATTAMSFGKYKMMHMDEIFEQDEKYIMWVAGWKYKWFRNNQPVEYKDKQVCTPTQRTYARILLYGHCLVCFCNNYMYCEWRRRCPDCYSESLNT